MPEIFELYDHNGLLKKYIELDVYPHQSDFVRIINVSSSQIEQFRTNIPVTISYDKAYQVLSVHNVTSIIILNNNNDSCHLRPKDYKVVKEVTDDELLNIKYRNDSLKALMNTIRKQKSTS